MAECPKMNELEELLGYISNIGGGVFKNRNVRIYIYGHEWVHKMIAKYMKMSRFNISGFIIPELHESDRFGEELPIISLAAAKRIVNKKNAFIIIAADDGMLNQVISSLKLVGLDNFYVVSEWNKQAIIKKMTPKSVSEFSFEISLADHCNLNCQCCDHFSPIAKERFLDYDQYKKDVIRLSELTSGNISRIALLGGEPLLNKRLIDYISLTRQYFPNSIIEIVTDGLLLPQWGELDGENNIWKAILKYDAQINMTRYPILMQMDRIIKRAEGYGIPVIYYPSNEKGARLYIYSELANPEQPEKLSIKHPFDLEGNVEKYRFISCYHFNQCITLRDGRIYTCPIIPNSCHYNERFHQNLQVKEDCYIDIYKATSFNEIAEFCTHRTSFCDYCAVHKRFAMPWKQSEHDMSEWTL